MRRTRIGHHCCADGSQLTWPTALSGNAISACNGRSLGHATPPTTPAQPSPHPSAQWGEPVNHLPIDPAAHSRRAWLPCPNCNHSHGCPQCQNNHNCQIHWQYLLKTAGTRVSLQCPTWAHMWTSTQHTRVDANLTSWPPFLQAAMHATSSSAPARSRICDNGEFGQRDRSRASHRREYPVGVDPKRTMVTADDRGSMSRATTVRCRSSTP